MMFEVGRKRIGLVAGNFFLALCAVTVGLPDLPLADRRLGASWPHLQSHLVRYEDLPALFVTTSLTG